MGTTPSWFQAGCSHTPCTWGNRSAPEDTSRTCCLRILACKCMTQSCARIAVTERPQNGIHMAKKIKSKFALAIWNYEKILLCTPRQFDDPRLHFCTVHRPILQTASGRHICPCQGHKCVLVCCTARTLHLIKLISKIKAKNSSSVPLQPCLENPKYPDRHFSHLLPPTPGKQVH